MIGIDNPVHPSANIERPVQNVSNQRTWATATTALTIVCVFGWLAFEIPKGILSGTDELLTAERTREMLLTEPWVVHFNFHRSFEKPPLQYWLTTLTLARFSNRTLAVRIWPLLYGCLTAIALVWLVRLIQPNRPWLMPLSVAVLASCPLFSPEASRALLDVGLAFFTTMTIVFAQLARRRPVWWLAAGAMCWLGSLQKLPFPFLVWLLIVLVRLTSRAERPALRNGWLIVSLLLAIIAMAIWPTIQFVKYQMPVASLFHEEVVVWTGSSGLGARPYFEVLIGLSTVGGLCGFLGLLAPFAILFSKKERASRATREIGIVSLAVLGLVIVSNFRSVRYVLPIVPCLCFLLSLALYWLFEQSGKVRRCAAIALVVLLAAGFVQAQVKIWSNGSSSRVLVSFVPAKVQIDRRQKDVANEKRIAEELGALQQAGTQTVLIEAIKPGRDLLRDSFYLFHGNFRFPVEKYTVDDIRSNPLDPPLIGACVARDFPVVQEIYPNVRVQLSRAQFVCWRVGTR
jgi:4-amino-4-deoxy-L-arabinose transferase-like glycosyltransferase